MTLCRNMILGVFILTMALGCTHGFNVQAPKPQSQMDVYLAFEVGFNEAVRTLLNHLVTLEATDPELAEQIYNDGQPIVEEANELLKIWNKIVTLDKNAIYEDEYRLYEILDEIKALTARIILRIRSV